MLVFQLLAIQDPRWWRAMEAISDSVHVSRSKECLCVYTRAESGEYKCRFHTKATKRRNFYRCSNHWSSHELPHAAAKP
ncbi:MAG: DUF3164 family protein [Treponema sp.]|nr:DUF3164 family protein [Treponema sp.]